MRSKVFHAKQRQINNQAWIDGFHSGSEVPSYFTRYLITIKGGLAILITYSGHKNHYNKYAADFANSINSLRVKDVPTSSSFQRGSVGVGSAQDYIQGIIDSEEELEGLGDDNLGGEGSGLFSWFSRKPELAGGLIGLLVLLSYILLKRRKKKNRDPKSDRDSSSSHRHRRSRSRRDRFSSRY